MQKPPTASGTQTCSYVDAMEGASTLWHAPQVADVLGTLLPAPSASPGLLKTLR